MILDGAACEGMPSEWFFDYPEKGIAVCGECGIKIACLRLGIKERLDGVWGGLTLYNGIVYREGEKPERTFEDFGVTVIRQSRGTS